MGRSGVRARASLVAAATLLVTACSLFTDFGGATGGGDDPPTPGTDAASSDATSGGDGTPSSNLDASDDTTVVVDPDGGDAGLGPGVLSKDTFDTSCGSWKAYNATVEHVTDAYAGGGACKVCLTMTGVGGGIKHSYDQVGPGTYLASAHVKNVNSTDARITIVRELDGGAVAHYKSVPFDDAAWHLLETSIDGTTLYDVSFWFGATYQPGDCALVDEITVRVEN
jgi:hypothetical protein